MRSGGVRNTRHKITPQTPLLFVAFLRTSLYLRPSLHVRGAGACALVRACFGGGLVAVVGGGRRWLRHGALLGTTRIMGPGATG